jgi:DNA repair photolyase
MGNPPELRTMNVPARIHRYPLATAIHRTPEFAKKKLAAFSVNVGLKCGHGCAYCSSGAVLRCHKAFRDVHESPFQHGYAIVDPDLPEKLASESKRIRKRGVVQLCTTVDAWCPAAQQYDLGRRCLRALLAEPGWTVRILTKNAAVARDFDLIEKHRDRVLVGLSLTGTAAKDSVLAAIEPNASLVSERMATLREANRRGLRTYGMLCPLMPGIANSPQDILALISFLQECGVEEVFSEAVNQRGPGLKLTEEVLRQASLHAEADALAHVRRAAHWSAYVADLIRDLQAAMRANGIIEKLRFLLYSTKLQPTDKARIHADDVGVIWL